MTNQYPLYRISGTQSRLSPLKLEELGSEPAMNDEILSTLIASCPDILGENLLVIQSPLKISPSDHTECTLSETAKSCTLAMDHRGVLILILNTICLDAEQRIWDAIRLARRNLNLKELDVIQMLQNWLNQSDQNLDARHVIQQFIGDEDFTLPNTWMGGPMYVIAESCSESIACLLNWVDSRDRDSAYSFHSLTLHTTENERFLSLETIRSPLEFMPEHRAEKAFQMYESKNKEALVEKLWQAKTTTRDNQPN